MTTDEQAIRDLVSTWHRATAAGDIDSVLPLMTDDAVFLVAGREPMRGRSAFEQGLRQLLQGHRIESRCDIQEVQVDGRLAHCWSLLAVRIIPNAGGEANERRGSALSILQKQDDGRWQLLRDANLLAAAT